MVVVRMSWNCRERVELNLIEEREERTTRMVTTARGMALKPSLRETASDGSMVFSRCTTRLSCARETQ